jgi:hypothetical protein
MCCHKVYFEILAIMFSLFVEVNISCHIAFLFTDIFTCSHTLVAPHGLQNLGRAFVLIYANDR